MTSPHFQELLKGLCKNRDEGLLLDANICTSNGIVKLHKLVLAIFSERFNIDIQQADKDTEFCVQALAYNCNDVEKLVDFLYGGSITLDPKGSEIIKSLCLDLSVDNRIRRHKFFSHSEVGSGDSNIQLEINYLRDLILEMKVPKLLTQPKSLKDIKIQTDTEVHQCHKLILSSVSAYFAAMFSLDMKESSDAIITLKGVDSKIFSIVLHFIYTGKCELNPSTAPELLATSVYLQIPTLQVHCEEYLIQQLDSNNCVDLWCLGQQYSCQDLTVYAWAYVVENFSQIPTQALVQYLELQDIKQLISNSELDVEKEDHILEFILQWVSVNSRIKYFNDLLALIQMEYVDDATIKKVLNNKLIKNNKQCADNLKIVFNKKVTSKLDNKTGKQQSRNLKDKCLLVVKRSTFTEPQVIELAAFSLKQKKWFRLTGCKFSAAGSGFAAVATDKDIYMSGGSRSPNSFFRYLVEDDSWMELDPLCQPRWAHAMGYVNSNVYALGGCADQSFDKLTGGLIAIASIEKFSLQSKRWKLLESELAIPTYDAAYATVKSCIYIFGGCVSAKVGVYLKDIQCFDASTETCTKLLYSLPFTQCLGSACTDKNNVYVVNPNGKFVHINVNTKSLSVLYESKSAHLMSFATAFYKHSVFIMGGYDTSGDNYNVRRFDTRNKKITSAKEMKLPFTSKSNHLFGAVVSINRQFLDRPYVQPEDTATKRRQPQTSRTSVIP